MIEMDLGRFWLIRNTEELMNRSHYGPLFETKPVQGDINSAAWLAQDSGFFLRNHRRDHRKVLRN